MQEPIALIAGAALVVFCATPIAYRFDLQRGWNDVGFVGASFRRRGTGYGGFDRLHGRKVDFDLGKLLPVVEPLARIARPVAREGGSTSSVGHASRRPPLVLHVNSAPPALAAQMADTPARHLCRRMRPPVFFTRRLPPRSPRRRVDGLHAQAFAKPLAASSQAAW
jgi:hypothetical protein